MDLTLWLAWVAIPTILVMLHLAYLDHQDRKAGPRA